MINLPSLAVSTQSLSYPHYENVPELIRAWAERTPDAIAITQNGQAWRYAELVHAAAVLTDRLTPGEVVAVTGQPSFGLIAAMLATLWSRAILLPIDVNLPARRQQLLLEQARAQRLIQTGAPIARDWAGQIEVSPATGRAVRVTEKKALAAAPLPADAAYIFFTSGTTGVPKAVLGCHQGLSHFLLWQRDTFRVGAADRVAQLTNISFDVMLRSVFLALVSSGTLCLPPAELALTPAAVLPWLQREQITILHVVPSLAQSWLADVTVPALRLSFFAGEPLPESLVRRWRAQFTATQVVNLYGPTETTMAKFHYVVPPEPDPGIQPVGWPLPHTSAVLLENDEIGIRTPYRTLGYLNDHAEQQRRFITRDGEVVYRTGDRGRFRADGALEILGRLDHQVKIQGVRIEPDEISAVMGGLPQVKSCIVIARQEPGREPFLIAYVVAQNLSEADLRAELARQLPAALIPARIQFLDQLPLTANGKVDRAALPAASAAPSFIAPRTALEQTLAGLWQSVLGGARVGLDDNFFERGGNSLRLTQVHAQLLTTLQREVPIAKLFQYPTIRALAGYLSQPATRPAATDAVTSRAARMRGALS